jgi:PEP-CTERM motif
MKKIILWASILGMAAIAADAQNANITWGAPTTISGTSDVSLAGTLYATWAPGDDYYGDETTSAANYTVNGVDFLTYGTSGANFAATSSSEDRYNNYTSPGTGDSIYNSLLQVATYNDNTDNITLSWNGMTAGDTYQVELWANDARGLGRTETFTGGANTSAALDISPTPSGAGQYIIGQFVADSSDSEDISIAAPAGGGYGPMLNLVEVRDLTPTPEPSTFALLAAGAGAMVFGLRWKNRAV